MNEKKSIVLIATVVITAMILMSSITSAVSNNDIASTAIDYEGQTIYGCQCKCFVQRAVNEAAGSYVLGRGYAGCYGDTEIQSSQAMRGDIIQISNDADPECALLNNDVYLGMHTAIVLENNGNNEFKVIDSHYLAKNFVGIHNWNPFSRASKYNLQVHFYRLGTIDLSADLNCDGNVNLADSSILMSFWGKDPSRANSCQSPDINQDGKVNLVDYSIMMSQWTG